MEKSNLSLVAEYRRMSANLNIRQMKNLPITISQAKDILRDQYLSEDMICKVLREVIVKKMVEGGIEMQRKKVTRVQASKEKTRERMRRKKAPYTSYLPG